MISSLPITGIDTHAHIFDPLLPMIAGRRYAPRYAATLDEWFMQMRQANISHGVLVQPSFYGTDNRLVAEVLSAHPGRLRGIAVLDRLVPESTLAEMDAQGFVGARLNLVGRALEEYADRDWQRFFHRLAEIGWQLEIQRAFEDFAQILPAMARAGGAVMIDHFGLPQGGIDPENPAHRAVLEALRATPNAWVKLSAPYRSGQDPAQAAASLTHLREACGGMDRFVWGSDWPHTQHEKDASYSQQVARLAQLLPDPADRRRVLVENPAALFRFT